jgi:hypothetical protein
MPDNKGVQDTSSVQHGQCDLEVYGHTANVPIPEMKNILAEPA